jgi:hypothetical protein
MRYFSKDALKEAMGRVMRSDTDTAYSVTGDPKVLTFPFPETGTGTSYPAVGAFWTLRAGSKQHTVGFCRRIDLTTDCWFPICGPAYMKGEWDAAKMTNSLAEAVSGLGRTSGFTAAEFKKQARDGVDFAKGDSVCGFWREYNAAGGRELGCKHVATVAFHLTQTGGVDSVLDLLTSGPGTSTQVAALTELMETFERVCPANPGKHRKFPVLVFGEFGEGKTTDARAFAEKDKFDVVIECHGHAGMEAIDFLGGTLALPGKEGLAWVDGPVTEAFRHAAAGRRVLLIVDEIRRVPRRERSVFLSALSPATTKDGKIIYRMKSGRPVFSSFKDLPPVIETLECPESHLSIIGTTNAGGSYDVEEDDPAEASRWHQVYYKMPDPRKLGILKSECKALGFAPSAAESLVKFGKMVRKLKEDGQAKQAPSLRELVRALHVADSVRGLPGTLKDMAASWVGLNTDGSPNAAQVRCIEHAATLAFK